MEVNNELRQAIVSVVKDILAEEKPVYVSKLDENQQKLQAIVVVIKSIASIMGVDTTTEVDVMLDAIATRAEKQKDDAKLLHDLHHATAVTQDPTEIQMAFIRLHQRLSD